MAQGSFGFHTFPTHVSLSPTDLAHKRGSAYGVYRLEKRKLDALRRNSKGNLTKMVNEIARAIERMAKEFVPVDTGALRDSIHIERSGVYGTGATKTIEVAVGSDLPYAKFPEFGTRYQAAQPFLLPAYEFALAYYNIPKMVEEYLIRKSLRGQIAA